MVCHFKTSYRVFIQPWAHITHVYVVVMFPSKHCCDQFTDIAPVIDHTHTRVRAHHTADYDQISHVRIRCAPVVKLQHGWPQHHVLQCSVFLPLYPKGLSLIWVMRWVQRTIWLTDNLSTISSVPFDSNDFTWVYAWIYNGTWSRDATVLNVINRHLFDLVLTTKVPA